jgi:glutathionylspermidine synthase
LFETSVVQRQWVEDSFPGASLPSVQFNKLNEQLGMVLRKLAASQRATVRYDGDPAPIMHFTTMTPNAETEGNARYLLKLAQASGLNSDFVGLTDIGWHSDGYFCDLQNRQISSLVKIWPLAWLLEDDFGQKLASEALDGNVTLIEPPWKLLAQNKRVLAAMWDRNAYHPMLLNTSPMNSPVLAGATGIVRKPANGVDGQNIRVYNLDGTIADETSGNYEADQFVFQERANLAQADGKFAVCNVWVVGGEACALGIREADTIIGDIAARFIPHAIG